MAEKEMVIIVTGSSRGIGKAICELILQTQSTVHLIATSRSAADLGLTTSSTQRVIYRKLDVSKPDEIQNFAGAIKEEYAEGVDVLINNAGVNLYPEHSPLSVRTMLDANFRGARDMSLSFLPQMRNHGRIVQLSSTASSLSIYSKEVAEHFRSISTLEEAESLATEYERLVAEKRETEQGFGQAGDGYPVSKALINAITRVLGNSKAASGKNVLINCCCPGWADTEMGGIMGKPRKTAHDAAKIPIRLAFGDIQGQTGKYWANASVHSCNDGSVQPW